MVDPGPMFRRALSWLPSHFVSVDQEALGAPPRFSSTDHLATEAVAAYVDGELPMKAHLRAASHLSVCPQCAAEVDAQSQARTALRECRPVSIPSTLMGLLSAIPESAPPDPPEPAPPFGPPPGGTKRGRRKRR
ncbi:MAG: RNA polymerase subunit sigma-70 [Mycobacterium sp.]|nr:MAG: RNA polymerase subunit sigma-70 [Mycobacterium sp.]HQE16159.1 anti-sigma E factor RseA [Mycobacterium sp.]